MNIKPIIESAEKTCGVSAIEEPQQIIGSLAATVEIEREKNQELNEHIIALQEQLDCALDRLEG